MARTSPRLRKTPLLLAGLFAFVLPMLAQAQTTVPAESALLFIGSWSVAVETEPAVTLRIDITNNAGQIAAGVLGLAGTVTPVPDISKTGESLVLKYSTELQGTAIPVQITLTPVAQTGNLAAAIDMAGGMATFAGTATPAAAGGTP